MRIVTVGFSSPREYGVGAELIKLWIKKPYSHVYIRYIDDQGRDLVFQAAHGMVHLITFDNFIIGNKLQIEYPLVFTDEEYQSFRDYYYSKLGIPYSYVSLFWIPIYDLQIAKPREDDSAYICSELAAEMLNIIKNYELSKPKNLMRPDDVEKMLQNVNKI